MGPVNYRPLKQLGSPGFIVEPPKHRTSIARIRVATPAQLRVVEKLLEPKDERLPDAAYGGPKLAEDPGYGKPCGSSQLAKTLAVYDQMLTLVVAIKSELPCEPQLLLFAGMNDHLHAAWPLEHRNGEAPTSKKIW